jgi:RNA recognition motif-containing protein
MVRGLEANVHTMANKLFVGNLAWEATADDLKETFGPYGTVTDAFVATDKFSGRSRGFGFVTFETEESAQEAKKNLLDVELKGRAMMVDDATERPQRD